MTTSTNAEDVEDAVVSVLAGVPLEVAAATVRMDPTDLADAVEVYQTAGAAALRTHAAAHSRWFQVRIRFTDWDTAEHVGAQQLGPALCQAHDSGVLDDWWFIRKHPCWRLRCRPRPGGPGATATELKTHLAAILDGLVAAGALHRWWETIYEPETLAFGGPTGMDIAHRVFHTDSRHILTHLRHTDPTTSPSHAVGRRELSMLLCATLMRGARQDRHEQGDVWHRVTRMRPLPPDTPTHRLPELAADLHRLLTADTSPASPLVDTDAPLGFAAAWASAFAQTGRDLADAARDGVLERGLRDVLADHTIFHWNRIGLPTRTQAVLAHAARDLLLNLPSTRADAHATDPL